MDINETDFDTPRGTGEAWGLCFSAPEDRDSLTLIRNDFMRRIHEEQSATIKREMREELASETKLLSPHEVNLLMQRLTFLGFNEEAPAPSDRQEALGASTRRLAAIYYAEPNAATMTVLLRAAATPNTDLYFASHNEIMRGEVDGVTIAPICQLLLTQQSALG